MLPDREDQPATPADSDDEPPELAPGVRIHHYELIRKLGRGGMGTVFLARDTRLGRRVAIKFLDRASLSDRFLFEARATARCSHPNIVVIHDVSDHHGVPYMVLEYLRGQPLSHLIATERLSPQRAVELVVPVVRALVCAHDQQIVHRDLKPENIFVTESGGIKVLDFGIAKALLEHQRSQAAERAGADTATAPSADAATAPDRIGKPVGDLARKPAGKPGRRQGGEQTLLGRDALTDDGALIGTMAFMSPEQWSSGKVDHRTDIWAVGLILYRMVTGTHPLAPLQGQQLAVTASLAHPMPSARDAEVDLPGVLADVIDRCLVKRKEDRMATARELLAALEPLLPDRQERALGGDVSPYTGLTPFQESDADRFFGRGKDIATLLARLGQRPLMGVVGPSGVGKSSFVRAGVVPALKRSGRWGALVIRPGRQPLHALAELIVAMQVQESTLAADDEPPERDLLDLLRDEPGYLGELLRSRARQREGQLLLFVDQFEELYTLTASLAERLAFTRALTAAADDPTSPVRVVLSIRSDFLDRVAEDREFMTELDRGLYFLTQLDREGMRDALTRPAAMVGYRFEAPWIVDQMLDALEVSPGALPLLQFTASKLWDTRDTAQRVLTERSYRTIGGVEGALASHANAVLAALSPQQQSLVRSLFLHLVTPERTRAIPLVSEVTEFTDDPDTAESLIARLVEARLLVVHKDDTEQGSFVEIVHESLIHSWPMLGHWLDEDQDDREYLAQLRAAAAQWDSRDRPTGLLWRGEAAVEARRWRQRYRGPLAREQREYLDEVAALAMRSARRRRAAVIGTIAVLSVLVVASAIALFWIQNAEREARAAETKVREQLEVIQDRERERDRQAVRAAEFQRQADEANAELTETNAELSRANRELRKALTDAMEAQSVAKSESARAMRSAAAALRATREAERAQAEIAALNEREKERLAREKERLAEERTRLERLEAELGARSKVLK